MDAFSIIVFGGLLVIFLAFLALGRWNPRRTRDITDKHQQQALGEMARIEERDIPEMIDAQNAYRRRHGKPETSGAEVRARVGAEELDKLDRANSEPRQRQKQRPDH
jgi:hypothetical protein